MRYPPIYKESRAFPRLLKRRDYSRRSRAFHPATGGGSGWHGTNPISGPRLDTPQASWPGTPSPRDDGTKPIQPPPRAVPRGRNEPNSGPGSARSIRIVNERGAEAAVSIIVTEAERGHRTGQ